MYSSDEVPIAAVQCAFSVHIILMMHDVLTRSHMIRVYSYTHQRDIMVKGHTVYVNVRNDIVTMVHTVSGHS